MLSSVNLSLLFVLLMGGLLTSCLPSEEGKSAVEFEDRRIIPTQPGDNGDGGSNDNDVIPIEASYKSVNEHLIKKSCLGCHNSNSPRISFETEQDVIDNAEDIAFYIEFGCDIGSCMPPEGTSPVPTHEILSAFKDWAEVE